MTIFLSKEKKQSFILLFLTLFILFLDSTGFNGDSIAVILGRFFGSLGLGVLFSSIYYKLAHKDKNNPKFWRLSTLIAFIDCLIIVYPSIKEAFIAGYQSGFKK
jgi:CDP-diglyceride synthetase